MPKSASTQTLVRQWEVLRLLPSRGVGTTVSEIKSKLDHQGIEVSKRTLERDLNELSRFFGILCNDKSKPYGWRWMDNAGLELPAMDIADAVSLQLVEKHIRTMLPETLLNSLEPKFHAAKVLLDSRKTTPTYAKWNDKIEYQSPVLTMQAPYIDHEVTVCIQEALVKERQVSIFYDSGKEMRLHPLGINQVGQVTYLIATAFEYNDPRMYALHRIISAKILDAPISAPDNFSMKEYVNSGATNFGFTSAIKIQLEVDSKQAKYLRETPLSEDMKITETPNTNRALVVATVNDSWQLRWWIMSRGSSVTVIEPQELRASIAQELAKACAAYS